MAPGALQAGRRSRPPRRRRRRRPALPSPSSAALATAACSSSSCCCCCCSCCYSVLVTTSLAPSTGAARATPRPSRQRPTARRRVRGWCGPSASPRQRAMGMCRHNLRRSAAVGAGRARAASWPAGRRSAPRRRSGGGARGVHGEGGKEAEGGRRRERRRPTRQVERSALQQRRERGHHLERRPVNVLEHQPPPMGDGLRDDARLPGKLTCTLSADVRPQQHL